MNLRSKGGDGSGDKPGHPFRGNQWTSSPGASDDPADIVSISKEDYTTDGGRLKWSDEGTYSELRKRKEEWESAARIAVSTGRMTPEAAEKLGMYSSNGGSWVDLPDEMWHVTTAKDAVVASGQLKTRKELEQDSGHGLGGGPSDTVSFTTDRSIAVDIKDAIIEARAVANGEITMESLITQAREGVGASYPFLTEMARFHSRKWNPGDPLPDGLVADMTGKIIKSFGLFEPLRASDVTPDIQPLGDGWIDSSGERRWHTAIVPNPDPDDIERRKFEVYKLFASFREAAGGKMNPLFFNSDSIALGKKRKDQISIVRVRPKSKARGIKVSGLGEIRTFTGDVVDIVDVE